MTERGITAENLLTTFPVFLQGDKRLMAMARIVAEELEKRNREVEFASVYTNIDHLPERVLDMLAKDFKVDWWDMEYSIEEKRQTLKDAWRVHRMMGTKAAVETAISAIYPKTKVEEWFEYGGEPYWFRLLIDATHENVAPEKHRKVLDRVDYYKNVRSHLDEVKYVAIPDGECVAYVGVAAAGIEMEVTKEVAVYGMG